MLATMWRNMVKGSTLSALHLDANMYWANW